MIHLPNKLPNAGTTIFASMSALANQHNAINLSQGFPDFDMDPVLINWHHQAMLKGMNQYAPMPGLPILREALSAKVQNLYQQNYSPETEITITPGATYAIYCAVTALIEQGDEVIVLEPAYDSYIPNIELNGGVPIRIPLNLPDFSINWSKVEKAINSKTKLIIINTPHNPSAYVWTENDFRNLENIVAGKNIFIISDEVYEHIIFDQIKLNSILNYPKLREQSIAIYSFGKVFHCTGWKMGYAIANENIMTAFRKIHQFVGFTTPTAPQFAFAKYLEDKNNYLDLPKFYQAKRDFFLELINQSKFKITHASLGSYFQLATYENISDLPDKEFAIWFTQKYGVATIPLSPFYQDGTDHKIIRFCFAKKDETLKSAFERIMKA